MRVYIAGPIALGDQFVNVRKAIDAAEEVMRAGHTPFVPHTDCIWHLVYPHTHADWLKWDFEWLKVCNALIRLPGKSEGADMEVRVANHHGIPVFYSVQEFLEAAETRVHSAESV